MAYFRIDAIRAYQRLKKNLKGKHLDDLKIIGENTILNKRYRRRHDG